MRRSKAIDVPAGLVAMNLRAMSMPYGAIKEKSSMVIAPSSAVDTMGLGGMAATAALGGVRLQ